MIEGLAAAAGLSRREALAESLPQLQRMAAARRRRQIGWSLRQLQALRVAVWGDRSEWSEVQKDLIGETER